ncbi:hypothetical protein [Sphaerisporangium corydalis]|uniref:Apea-like HEPN domain-containing protein n=1 Tax=Sphaerisporangium corydalis TaxID=1441875 RepID=A0ABV9EQ45_9ACTN|nr:hypothetical protein [Sphaerisporangium corydalis]
MTDSDPAAFDDELPNEVLDEGVAEDATSNGGEILAPNEDEERAIRLLDGHGYSVVDLSNLFIKFRAKPADGVRSTARHVIPRSEIGSLLRQLSEEFIEHPDYRGILIPGQGYFEVFLAAPQDAPSLAWSLSYLRSDTASECPHRHGQRIPRIALEAESEVYRRRDVSLHLGDASGKCLEISNLSPLAAIVLGPTTLDAGNARRFPWRTPRRLTLKVDLGREMNAEDLVASCEKLMQSLFYELDIRNGVAIAPVRRSRTREKIIDNNPPTLLLEVRHPRIQLKHEVASLFGFATWAQDSPPLAFLSYYQVLEYFLPVAVRLNTLGRLRRELNDPHFDRRKDESLMDIMKIAEGAASMPESQQLKTLIKALVRPERLEEFLSRDWGDHFGKKGKISGVGFISLSNPSVTLADQVAERVYRLRNRIVHAKDDPKYSDAPVLLPQSPEAEALGCDVLLVRFLASEAILATQPS